MHETKENRKEVKTMIDQIAAIQKELKEKASYWNEIVNEMKEVLNTVSKPISVAYKNYPDHRSGILIDDKKNPHIWLTSDGKLLEVYLEKDNEFQKLEEITIEHVIDNYEQYDTSTWLASRAKAIKDGLASIEKKKNALSGIPSNLRPVNT